MSEATPVQGVPALGARMQNGETETIPITRLHVPLTMTIMAISVAASFVLSIGLAWASIVSHTQNTSVHVSPDKKEQGGGLAYRLDVDQAKREFERKLVQEQQLTRLLLKSMSINCSRDKAKKGNELGCSVDLPEASMLLPSPRPE